MAGLKPLEGVAIPSNLLRRVEEVQQRSAGGCSNLCTRRRGRHSGQSTGARGLCGVGAGVRNSLQASAQKIFVRTGRGSGHLNLNTTILW
jgi:hypothetical protein